MKTGVPETREWGAKNLPQGGEGAVGGRITPDPRLQASRTSSSIPSDFPYETPNSDTVIEISIW